MKCLVGENGRNPEEKQKTIEENGEICRNNGLCGSCSGSFKDVIRGVYWIKCTNCDLWYHETRQGLRECEYNQVPLDANMKTD